MSTSISSKRGAGPNKPSELKKGRTESVWMAEEYPPSLLLLYLDVYCVCRVCRNRLAGGDVDDVQEKPQPTLLI